jgi:hypothetical protein
LQPETGSGQLPLTWLRQGATANSPEEILAALEKLTFLKQLGVDGWDLSWLSPNRSKYLAQVAKKSTGQALRRAPTERRYPILLAFLAQRLIETTDEAVDLYCYCLAATEARVRRDLDEFRQRIARATNEKLHLLQQVGQIILDPEVADDQVRPAIYRHIPQANFQTALTECAQIIRPLDDNYFDFLAKRYSYLRQFAPAFLEVCQFRSHLKNDALLEVITLLRELNQTHCLNLVTNAVVIWNTVYMTAVLEQLKKGDAQDAFNALAAGERNVIVNGILAASTNLNVGDVIPLVTTSGVKDYRIVAIGGEVLSMKINTAYISQANMKSDFRKSEDIFYQVDLAPGADPATVEQRLAQIVEDYPQFRLVAGREYTAEFRRQYDAIYAGFYVLLGVLAFPSLIAILNTLAIGVIERTREIGMLRAIGATRGQVWKTIVAEALLLASLGTAFGILAGLYLSYVFVQGVSASGIFKVVYTFLLAGVLAAIAAGLIFGVLAALFPARQASSMEIIKALRYE